MYMLFLILLRPVILLKARVLRLWKLQAIQRADSFAENFIALRIRPPPGGT